MASFPFDDVDVERHSTFAFAWKKSVAAPRDRKRLIAFVCGARQHEGPAFAFNGQQRQQQGSLAA